MLRRSLHRVLLLTAAVVLVLPTVASAGDRSTATLTVSGSPSGTSTCFIGATEGNVDFDVRDLRDAGISTYRIYGGMQRWEAEDDDGVYGSPSIAEIKRDAGVINWSWWDSAMTSPPGGSDYWWSGDENLWHGNARTLFGALKKAGVKVVLTLRNIDNNNRPPWAHQLNPPTDQAGWNEWWEHVFATVYWLNVRNRYDVTDFEVHNEPDNFGQGWHGTQAEYFELVRVTKDAIDHVFERYLPGKRYHVYSPVTVEGSTWPRDALEQVGDSFDSVDVHTYNWDVRGYLRQVHGWMNDSGRGHYPLWVSEWGSYVGGYEQTVSGVWLILRNLIHMSSPGDDRVHGSHLFTFYDWDGYTGEWQNFPGLISKDGTRLSNFYALRMGTRALNGCKRTHQATPSSPDLSAIATRNRDRSLYLLVTNIAETTDHTIDADLSALHLRHGKGTLWRYDAAHEDTRDTAPRLSRGHATFTVPATGAALLRFSADR
jgi:hypothetical protein